MEGDGDVTGVAGESSAVASEGSDSAIRRCVCSLGSPRAVAVPCAVADVLGSWEVGVNQVKLCHFEYVEHMKSLT